MNHHRRIPPRPDGGSPPPEDVGGVRRDVPAPAGTVHGARGPRSSSAPGCWKATFMPSRCVEVAFLPGGGARFGSDITLPVEVRPFRADAQG